MRKRRKRHVRLGSIECEILDNLNASDMFVGFLCSAMSTRTMYKVASARARKRYQTRLALGRLISQGYVHQSGDSLSISLSGKALHAKTAIVRERLLKKKWDGKWRAVIFDIPEKLSSIRGEVRVLLKRAGFVRLQQSVWVFPHECQDLSDLIKRDKRIARYVLYGVFESITDDAELRRSFGLR
jgi:hypothetical protein